MLEDIRLNEFPKSSGVYKIIWNGAVIYVGSSNNLYQRMIKHRHHIKDGYASCYKNGKKGFYLFLQNNPFTIEFELIENYREKEQELIEYFEPIFNEVKAYTGLTKKEYVKRYSKQRYETHKNKMIQLQKQYREVHKEERKQYDNQYYNRKCNFNGEILTLNALAARFKRQRIPHPNLEAKKYLISN